MIYTFYKAQGYAVGKSLVEEDKLELATSLIEKAKAKGVSLLLPTDIVVADKFAPDAESKVCSFYTLKPPWHLQNLYFLRLVVKTVVIIQLVQQITNMSSSVCTATWHASSFI